jgi:predicted secreted protein
MEHVELHVHASYAVVLKGLGSAGYRWSVSVDNPQIAKVELVATTPDPRREHGKEQFTVWALAPGKTIVRFSQARSFEPQKPPRSTYELEVRVT